MRRLMKIAPIDERSSLARGRRGSTAVMMDYPMWLMPASQFLRLSELRPHEELRAEGKVVEYDPSHITVFYISHQWTSENHPDYSTAQLRATQTLLLRMQRGELPETAPSFVDAIRLPSDIKINSKKWQTLVSDAFIWMDYLSVSSVRVQVCTHGCVHLLTCVVTHFPTDSSSKKTDERKRRSDRPGEGHPLNLGVYREMQSLLRSLSIRERPTQEGRGV